MALLRDVVQGLAARDGVDAVVVLSSDGLPIDHASRKAFDADAVAALAASFVQGAHRLGAIRRVRAVEHRRPGVRRSHGDRRPGGRRQPVVRPHQRRDQRRPAALRSAPAPTGPRATALTSRPQST